MNAYHTIYLMNNRYNQDLIIHESEMFYEAWRTIKLKGYSLLRVIMKLSPLVYDFLSHLFVHISNL